MNGGLGIPKRNKIWKTCNSKNLVRYKIKRKTLIWGIKSWRTDGQINFIEYVKKNIDGSIMSATLRLSFSGFRKMSPMEMHDKSWLNLLKRTTQKKVSQKCLQISSWKNQMYLVL